MHKIISTILLTMSLSTFANSIEVSNVEYKVEQLGKFFYITKLNPTLSLVDSIDGDHPRVFKTDCEEIEKNIDKLSRRIKRCEDDFNSTSCNYTKDRVFELALENLEIRNTPSRYLKLKYDIDSDASVVQEISKKLNIPTKKLLIQKELSSNFEIKSLLVRKSDKSLMSKVESLGLFTELGVESYFYNQYIKVSNRLVYCDLKNGYSNLEVSISTELSNNEIVSSEVKNTGFDIYKTLKNHNINSKESKVVQAANIGFIIGDKLKNKKIDISISEVFNDLISDEHRNLQLKSFKNRSDLVDQLYADKTISKKIVQSYNAKIED